MLDAAGISNFQPRARAKTGICAHENRGVVDASVYKQSGFKLEGHGDMMNHHCIHLSLIPPTCKLIPCTMDDSRVYSLHWTEEIHMLMKDKPGSASFFVSFLSAK